MATSKQEQIYNEIVEYYDYADKLITILEESKDASKPEQLQMIEEVVESLEKYADQLTTNFIEFIKEGNSKKTTKEIRDALNGIIFQVEKYKSQIHDLYDKKTN